MKTEYVRSGTYRVESSSPLALEAVLGTCVGVGLYDGDCGVGGLHHILLPDPVYLDQHAERYASSGLPLFIQELCRQGADPRNLRAQVAGGALVGTLSYHDFDLDIGGRTTERVMSLLQHARIPLEDFVTGGITGCRIRLELPAMAVKIHNGVWSPPERSPAARSADRDQVLAAIDNLSPIPQVALRILRNYQNERFALSDLTEALKQDQVLSAQTIKLANSALYKRVREVDTLQGAVGLLGRDTIIKCVVLKAVEGLFRDRSGGYSLCQGGLFHHARRTAQLCELMARTSQAANPNSAFLAGLLHDIGKVVLDQRLPEVASRFYQALEADTTGFLRSEKRLMGMDHTEAGGLLARKWGFPPSLVEAIEGHHQPASDDFSASCVVGLVHLADLLLARFAPGLTVSFPPTQDLLDRLKRLNLTPQQLDGIIDAIPASDLPLAA